MSLTKENLIDAHEQGLNVHTKGGTSFKVLGYLMDVFMVKYNHYSNKITLYDIDKINDLQCTIEQPKPKYNGMAVKCDSYQQYCKVLDIIKIDIQKIHESTFLSGWKCVNISNARAGIYDYYITENYKIISFSQYCTENGIVEPKWVQGFEVKDGYNDVVMVSADKNTWHCHLLTSVNDKVYPFHIKSGVSWKYCRYPRKDEINEIKFVD